MANFCIFKDNNNNSVYAKVDGKRSNLFDELLKQDPNNAETKYKISKTDSFKEQIVKPHKVNFQKRVTDVINSYIQTPQKKTAKFVTEFLKARGLNINILSEEDMLKEAKKRGYDSFNAMVESWKGINKYEVYNDLENTSTIQLNFEQGSVTIGEVYGLYDFLEDFEGDFKDPEYFLEIQDLQIKPEFQGQGKGKELLKDTISYVEKNFGDKDIYLNASPVGNRALSSKELSNFYSTEGFKVLEDEGSNVTMVRKGKNTNTQFLNQDDKVHGFYDTNTKEIYLTEELLSSKNLVHEMYHWFRPILKDKAQSGDQTSKEVLNQMENLSLELLGGTEAIKKRYDSQKTTDGNLNFSEQADDIKLQYNEKGEHLAPNGKPSNLTEEQAKIVRTEAFKNWFGDWQNDPENASKVIDENGEPMVMYHSTMSNEFFEFNPDKIGTGAGVNYGEGYYFESREKEAKWYTEGKGRVIQVFLSSKDPVNYYGADAEMRANADGISDNINEENVFEGGQFMVKTPDQIKLADGSNTTFDSASNDIRFMTNELNSDVYNPRENESFEDYKDRMVEEASAILLQNNSEEYFEKIAKDNGLNETETKSFIQRVKDFIKSFSNWLVDQLGIENTSPEEVANLTQKELFNRITTSMLRGKNTSQNTRTKDKGISFQVIGEKRAQKIEDYKKRLDKAKELEKKGVSLSEISDRTGWYKFQGDWRLFSNEALEQFKINEDAIKQGTKQKLSDILSTNNILYDMYPTLREVQIKVSQDSSLSNQASYENKTKTIQTNLFSGRGLQAAIAHEITHFVQQQEALPTGANYDTLINQLGSQLDFIPKGVNIPTPMLINELKKNITEENKSTVNALLSLIDDSSEQNKYKVYRAVLGEIDAHLVTRAYTNYKKGQLGDSYELLLIDELDDLGLKQNDVIKIKDKKQNEIPKQEAQGVLTSESSVDNYSVNNFDDNTTYQFENGQVGLEKYKDGKKVAFANNDNNYRKAIAKETEKGNKIYKDKDDIIWDNLDNENLIKKEGEDTYIKQSGKLLDNNNEPSVQTINKYITSKELENKKATKKDRADIIEANIDYESSNEMLSKMEKAMMPNGFFNPTFESLTTNGYTETEALNILDNLSLQNKLKNNIGKLRNEENTLNEYTAPKYRNYTTEARFDGSFKTQNPFILKKQAIEKLGDKTKQQFDNIVRSNELFYAKDDFTELSAYKKINKKEIVDNKVKDYKNDTRTILEETLIEPNKEQNQVIQDIVYNIISVDNQTIEANMDDYYKSLNDLKNIVAELGLDLTRPFSPNIQKTKDFITEVSDFFVENDFDKLANAYDNYYNIKTDVEYEFVKNADKNNVIVENEKPAEVMFSEYSLLKQKDGTYKSVDTELTNEEMYDIVQSYRQNTNRKDIEQQVESIIKKQGLNKGDTKFVLYNMYYNDTLVFKDNPKENIKQLIDKEVFNFNTEEVLSEINKDIIKEKIKNSEKYNNFYSNMKVTKYGIKIINSDPISMAKMDLYMTDKIKNHLLTQPNGQTKVKTTEIKDLHNLYNRNYFINFAENAPKPKGLYSFKTEDVIETQNKESGFINIEGDVYENTNNNYYKKLPKNDSNYIKIYNINPEGYSETINNREPKITIKKNYNEKVNREFEC